MSSLLSSRPQTKYFVADLAWISWEVLPVAFHTLDNPHEQSWLNQLPLGNGQKHKWLSGERSPKVCVLPLPRTPLYFLVCLVTQIFFPPKFYLMWLGKWRYCWKDAMPYSFHNSGFDFKSHDLCCCDGYEQFLEGCYSRGGYPAILWKVTRHLFLTSDSF